MGDSKLEDYNCIVCRNLFHEEGILGKKLPECNILLTEGIYRERGQFNPVILARHGLTVRDVLAVFRHNVCHATKVLTFLLYGIITCNQDKSKMVIGIALLVIIFVFQEKQTYCN